VPTAKIVGRMTPYFVAEHVASLQMTRV